MLNSKFWTGLIVVEIVLYLIFAYYIHRVRLAIRYVDAAGIANNFYHLNILLYVLFIITYFIFIAKYFNKSANGGIEEVMGNTSGGKGKDFCGLNCVALALLMILIVYTRKFQSILDIANHSPVPIEIIDQKFHMVENLGKILVIFIVVSKFLILGSSSLKKM
jgi:hypothetical protein